MPELTPRQMLVELSASGVSYAQVASFAGKHVHTIECIANGKTKDPRWSVVSQIQALHQVLVQKPQSFVGEGLDV